MALPERSGRTAMRLSALVSEAGLDLARGVARAVWCALALGLVLVALVVVDGSAARRVIDQAHDFQARGAATLVLSLPGGIDGRLCDALARQPGVRAAGAVRVEADPLMLAPLPDSPLTWYSVSPGFAWLLPGSTGFDQAGLLVSREVAQRFGLTVGRRLDFVQPAASGSVPGGAAAGATRLAGLYDYPQDGRSPGFGYAVLALAPAAEPFDQCWLDQYPVVPATSDLLYSVILPDADTQTNPPQVQQHNGSLGAPQDPAAAWRRRPTAAAWWAAGLAGAVIGAVSIVARRLELASNAHAGQSRPDRLAQIGLETAAWALTAAAVGAGAVAWVSAGLDPADRPAVARALAAIVWSGAAGAVAGALAALQNPGCSWRLATARR